jgi:hypothetical protein
MTPQEQLSELDIEATRILMQKVPLLPMPAKVYDKWLALATFSEGAHDQDLQRRSRDSMNRIVRLLEAIAPPVVRPAVPAKPERTYSVTEAAKKLGIDPSRVRHHCIAHNIGTKAPDGSRRLTREDIATLKKRPGRGRPKKVV